MNYDFSTLNDKELEQFSRDILNSEFNLDLQDFKAGKDAGIDLRHSTQGKNNHIVVQVKHYIHSGYRKLYNHLKNNELPKIKKLNPTRYVLVTSVPLSAKNKDDIKSLLSPFIQTPNDIIGQEDLNKYLRKHRDIERNWFKLWLSSTTVLQRIINNGIWGKSIFFEESIKHNIRLYVKNKSFDDAFRILKKYNYLLITGQPGVGKTTLAKLLTYDLLANGFKVVYVDDNIRDAEDVFSNDPNEKQVFYFDDFLGANYLEITNPKTTESRLLNFIERVKKSKNKLLILTTRTTIFQNALSKYEKLNRANIDIARKEIILGEYSLFEKAQILYNHIFHSDLPKEYRNQIFKDKRYWNIIKHRNYNPRLIEFFTTKHNFIKIPSRNYLDFITSNLNNPEQIWSHAYKEQFTTEEKILLKAIFSLERNTNFETVKQIFNEFLSFETQHYNYVPIANPFDTACRKLLDGIVFREIIIDPASDDISFINPSINDFLINYFIINEEDRLKLFQASNHLIQFEYYFESIITKIDKNAYQKNVKKIADLLIDKKKSISYDKYHLYSFLSKFGINYELVDQEIFLFFKENGFKHPYGHLNELLTIYSSVNKNGKAYNLIKEKWDDVALDLAQNVDDEDSFDTLLDLFDCYDVNFHEYVNEETDFHDAFYDSVKYYVDGEITQMIDEGESSLYSEGDLEKLKDKVYTFYSDFFDRYSLNDYRYEEWDFFNELDETISEVIENNENRIKRRNRLKDQPMVRQPKATDDTNAIDDLFSQQ